MPDLENPTIINYLDLPGLEPVPAGEMQTLHALFNARVKRSPDAPAYQQYNPETQRWNHFTWGETAASVAAWRATLATENLQPGDKVGIRRGNGLNWVLFDQAALSLGLVVVPLYVDDRPDNVAYIIEHAEIKLLYIECADQWRCLKDHLDQLEQLQRIVIEEDLQPRILRIQDKRIVALKDWLKSQQDDVPEVPVDSQALATIVYTSGTTGRPKGVMLSHRNITENVRAGINSVMIYPDDRLVSFLPLSHMFERMAGYYMSMMAGSEVIYARSIPELAEDLQFHKPTVLISVPRIYERVYGKIKAKLASGPAIKKILFEKTVDVGWARYEYRQGLAKWQPKLLLWPVLDKIVASKVREKLGGQLRFALSGGAPLPPSIARVFIGLGIELFQGYGLTESSPVITVNTLEYHRPASIGLPVRGEEIKIGDHDELLARGPNIMMGYWKNPEATAAAIDSEGWLHTGDQARIEKGFVYITGRLKEIIVLANGEKVPPADMESAIAEDALFEQSMVVGEGKAYLSCLVVLNPDIWEGVQAEQGEGFDDLDSAKVQAYLLERIKPLITRFPGYAQIHRVAASFEPWTVDNGLSTPTMKIRRARIVEQYQAAIDGLYLGHE